RLPRGCVGPPSAPRGGVVQSQQQMDGGGAGGPHRGCLGPGQPLLPALPGRTQGPPGGADLVPRQPLPADCRPGLHSEAVEVGGRAAAGVLYGGCGHHGGMLCGPPGVRHRGGGRRRRYRTLFGFRGGAAGLVRL
ncbi:hypothetical protein PLESTM_001251700, partial [Pleodorina starrii]